MSTAMVPTSQAAIVQHASPKVRDLVASLNGRLARMKDKIVEVESPTAALMDGGMVIAGAAGAGFIAGALGDEHGEIDGFPIALILAILLLGLGLGADQPWLVKAASGAASGYAQSYGFSFGSSIGMNKSK